MSRAPFLLGLLIAAAPAAGWGPTGHRAVGLIAERQTPEAARQAAAALLAGSSFADAAVWADDIRSDPVWEHTGPWHYVNLSDRSTYETAPRNPGGDVLTAIERFSRILADRDASQQQRRDALRFLIHFVGDLHQPLHVGRAADRGGNSVEVSWFGERWNLHALWDAGLLDRLGPSGIELADHVESFPQDQIRAWRESQPIDWLRESYELRTSAYDTRGGSLGPEYLALHGATVKRRIAQAGVRLAALLERLLP